MNCKDVLMRSMVSVMGNEYERLYKLQAAGAYIPTFYDAMRAGDDAFKNIPEFCKNFVKCRGDLVVSDRERAAFGYTLKTFGFVNF